MTGNVDVSDFSGQKYERGTGGRLAMDDVEMDRRVEVLFKVIAQLAGLGIVRQWVGCKGGGGG